MNTIKATYTAQGQKMNTNKLINTTFIYAKLASMLLMLTSWKPGDTTSLELPDDALEPHQPPPHQQTISSSAYVSLESVLLQEGSNMFKLNRLRMFSVVVYCMVVVFTLGFLPFALAGNTKTITRSDYNKDDYLLFMTTIGEIPTSSGTHTRVTSNIYGLSGSPGEESVEVNVGKNVELPNPTNYYALTGLGLQERKNNPCVLKLYGTLVDPRYQGETRVVAEQKLKRCRYLLPGIDYKDISFPESDQNFDFTKNGKHFVHKVRVCGGHATILSQLAYSSQMWEIKGVKAVPSEVKFEDSPVLKPYVTELGENEGQVFTRANCLNIITGQENKPGWSVWSECPTGQVATGVRAYYAKDKYFTGLKLNCKSVASRKIDNPPVKDSVGY